MSMMTLMSSDSTKSMMTMLGAIVRSFSQVSTGWLHLSAHWDLTEEKGWSTGVQLLGVSTAWSGMLSLNHRKTF